MEKTNYKQGDILICLSDFGWTPGCVTVGKTYKVGRSTLNIPLSIIGNNGFEYSTKGDGFELYSNYLSKQRENKINSVLN